MLKMTGLLPGGVGTVMCCDNLDLAVSGKRSTPLMEEKTVLLQSTPGIDEIGNHSPSTLRAGKSEGPENLPPSMG